ncbi:hypothetical protein B0H13DRAFT_1516484, partial [Mycena leptocephala]
RSRVPTLNDLANLCGNKFYKSDFLQKESELLSAIQWKLERRTAAEWLDLMFVVPRTEDIKVQHVARFLMEITLYYPEFIGISSSSVALAALTLALFIEGKSHKRSSVETEECFKIIDHLDTRLARDVDSDDLSETLVRKYSYDFYSNAAEVVVQYYLQSGPYVRPTSSTVP